MRSDGDVFTFSAQQPFRTGVHTGCHYVINLCLCVCQCVCFSMCNIRRFTHCESFTKSISTNRDSMEVGEYGLTLGTCFVAHRLEVVAVAGLLWITWCVLGGRIFSCSFLFSNFLCS